MVRVIVSVRKYDDMMKLLSSSFFSYNNNEANELACWKSHRKRHLAVGFT